MKSVRMSLHCVLLMMLCSVAAKAQSVQTDYLNKDINNRMTKLVKKFVKDQGGKR